MIPDSLLSPEPPEMWWKILCVCFFGACAMLGYGVMAYRRRWLDVQAKGSYWMEKANEYQADAEWYRWLCGFKSQPQGVKPPKGFSICAPSKVAVSFSVPNKPANDAFVAGEVLDFLIDHDPRWRKEASE